MKNIVLVAGATGNLGLRIVKALVKKGAQVRVVVRANSNADKIKALEALGAEVYIVTNWDLATLTAACQNVACVVSALAGLRDVVIDAQKILLDAAVAAGVPRFIPSDYSLDFTKFSHGENRNLDLRREFHTYLDKAPIAATSIFIGAFADMLTNEMPVILFDKKMVLYWGNADYHWGFTTIDNTAEYTAHVALDPQTPRHLVVAGDQISPTEIRAVMNEVTGEKYKLFRPGGKSLLGFIIKVARKLAPAPTQLYPAWQGMQYMHNMIDERSKIEKTDNNRYPGMQWTTVRDVLVQYKASGGLAEK